MQPTWRMRHAQSFLMYNKLTTDNTHNALRCEAGRVKRLSQGSLIRVMREIDNLLGLPAATTAAEVFFHFKILSLVYLVCGVDVMSSLENVMNFVLYIFVIFKNYL